jgi:hypothetical protein
MVCHSKVVRKSRRWGLVEKAILPFLGLRPYRCETCNTRYFGLFFAVRDREGTSRDRLRGAPPNSRAAAEN